MDRSSQRRILKIENCLSAAKKEREEKRKSRLRDARLHATAVAAIVLSGEPKIDEPLIQAWRRALQHYGIPALLRDGTNLDDAARTNDQIRAAQQLFPVILAGAKEAAKFTEIFRTAPGWLLHFTSTLLDSAYLGFDLPQESWRPKWGTAGYKESRQWPLLPLGTMTDGDPVPDKDARLWLFPLGLTKEADRGPDFEVNVSQEDEDNPSREAELVEDAELLLDLAENPEKERELSRYEKHRLRNLFEYLSLLRRAEKKGKHQLQPYHRSSRRRP
jgi:hypothetical protein